MKDFLVTFWENNSEKVLTLGKNVLLLLLVIVAATIVSKLLRKGVKRINERNERFDETLVPMVSSTLTYLVYIVAVIIVLDIFGINTTSIIALLGAAGLAIGLALKDTLGNIAAGVLLVILRPFHKGDYIETGSYEGTVVEINFFNTIMETFDGLYISAPNSAVFNNSMKNYTRNGKRRLDITIRISYGDSIDTALEVLNRIAAEEQRFLPEPAAQVIVTAMADSSVNLQLRGWTDVVNYWATRFDLIKKVKVEIEKAGLTIPFPQRDVHLYPNK
ncbi:MAG: mechanosensitive ion channel family protein [Candidatus Neomarinimicrobiota bacterium]|jgi:small conductance mechanosensitive channel|nr:mechanosensitive ion channel family protein [Candidatus Neomarinimicrobiota bacterium]MDD3965647.1 mechanosensitive ion channel family protein [Candidatus Neomarinimicrobiota bacterium]MDX9781027.1 mechanosensitive ion channel family protein [bacterium]